MKQMSQNVNAMTKQIQLLVRAQYMTNMGGMGDSSVIFTPQQSSMSSSNKSTSSSSKRIKYSVEVSDDEQ